KSGSGKSTLLRCIAGLIAPSSGEVRYEGQPLNGACEGISMVFQSFALLPWLTVLQNVELGLEARGVPEEQRRAHAERAIDQIGLDGFESAYPKELSGGMRQRVGFARALVVEPAALLMDEPFSALDVLTAENLRTELLRLWETHDFPTKAILIVTHNIEESVLLADRIFVLSSNPGRIKTEIRVVLPRPRDRRAPAFEQLVDEIYGIMTGRAEGPSTAELIEVASAAGSPIELPLPPATVGGLAGLLEILESVGGKADLPDLARELVFEVDDLLPLVDAAQLLGLADVHDADIELTKIGRDFVAADILTSKQLFAEQAKEHAPLVRSICKALANTKDGTLDERFFLDLLRRGFSEDEARDQLETAIDWGRYGELFEYDADTGQLRLTEGRTEAVA
ncbi:MAG TPA: nitrate/sulfonate/bicarbonate ABC transporter ATP-binding protein, partial [Acidimicrobiales bacterium]|nr:nitrate/sulfonate/bicarbonate ABC transporter ATP-binding protein [Acidimicrobiales bacterium]